MNFPDPNLPELVIVDDCQDDAFLLRYRLRQGGIANPVTTIESASAALEHLCCRLGHRTPPQVVFVDIKMEAGCDVIRAVRNDHWLDDTKVVVTTYSNAPEDLKLALELRADGYLLKFPDPDILADFVLHGPWIDVSPRPIKSPHALCA